MRVACEILDVLPTPLSSGILVRFLHYMAAMATTSRGFRPLKEMLSKSSICSAQMYDRDYDGLVMDVSQTKAKTLRPRFIKCFPVTTQSNDSPHNEMNIDKEGMFVASVSSTSLMLMECQYGVLNLKNVNLDRGKTDRSSIELPGYLDVDELARAHSYRRPSIRSAKRHFNDIHQRVLHRHGDMLPFWDS